MYENKYHSIILLFQKEKQLIKKNYFSQVKNIHGEDSLLGNIQNPLDQMKSTKKMLKNSKKKN
jgi:hypothetical protein